MHAPRSCYLDNNATTRVAPEVFEAMVPLLTEKWGNASSVYRFGKELVPVIREARERVARLIGARPAEIVFTSCGTESTNTAFNSALRTQPGRRHFITTTVEHSATMACVDFLRKQGCEVTLLPVAGDGTLDLRLLEQALRPDTALVSIMWANNETGVLFPVAEAAAICRARGVLFHTDAVQAAGKMALDAGVAGVDFLSLSAHKVHAPKGIGVLYLRSRVPFHPLILGGGQESGRRGGTENVPYIAGFGKAAELALGGLETEIPRVRRLRDRMEAGILERIPNTVVNGNRELRLPNTSSICFGGVEAESVLLMLDAAGICASSGSACSTGALKPSHVLIAMGLDPWRAQSTVRFSLGKYNTGEDVDHVLGQLPLIIAKLRGASPAAVDPG